MSPIPTGGNKYLSTNFRKPLRLIARKNIVGSRNYFAGVGAFIGQKKQKVQRRVQSAGEGILERKDKRNCSGCSPKLSIETKRPDHSRGHPTASHG